MINESRTKSEPQRNNLTEQKVSFRGLDENSARNLLSKFGRNTISLNENKRAWHILLDVVREPMFMLLAAAALLYFIIGETGEGFLMIAALFLVAAISLYQEVRSSSALTALGALTEKNAVVIREGIKRLVPTQDLVPGDLIIIEEGGSIPADAIVLSSNDLLVNEAILTGESLPLEKTSKPGVNHLYQGTIVLSGRCIAEVTETGGRTALGKIGKSLTTFVYAKTTLQIQMGRFVQKFALFGVFAFLIVFFVNFFYSHQLVNSFLFGLTLAMSVLPEEIPVAFSSFTALGAYHLSRLGIISRQPQTIENLGAVKIICLDKTGTITENRMEVKMVFDFATHQLANLGQLEKDGKNVLYYGMLASETDPFDTMEIAITQSNNRENPARMRGKLVREYPLGGHPPMMTHVFEFDGERVAAGKGAVERMLNICKLEESEKTRILDLVKSLAKQGQRIIGVAKATVDNKVLPDLQDEFSWKFLGLISLYDPPRPFINKVLIDFRKAGISLKLLTGDFGETACAISNEIGLTTDNKFITGKEIMEADEESLINIIQEQTIFARMHPEAKLRVINSLVKGGNIVAMTGDGVNDGPALKAASIGIALGKSGSEVARQASDLVITDDDLRKLSEAILQGRKIFSNLKKAIRYIISIHIPIILTASIPLLFGWKYPNIFTPIHVIFLELIMGPTCSIFYEREPVEADLMDRQPRKKEILFNKSELVISIIQGLVISLGVLSLEYYYITTGSTLEFVRTMVFVTLLLANVCLTFANRSFSETIFKTIRYKNNLTLPLLSLSAAFLLFLLFVPWSLDLFGLEKISFMEFFFCISTALIAVGWFELFKGFRQMSTTVLPDKKQFF